MSDLLIAGGGPAGLITALYARRAGLAVVVVEPRPAPIDKACGEGLMPGTARALRELCADHGVALPGMPFTGITYLDGAGRVAGAAFRDGAGLGVRRVVLHAALGEAAARAGVEVVPGRVVRVDQGADGVRAALGDGSRLGATHLVAADGLHSAIRRGLGLERPDPRRPRWGLRRHYARSPWTDRVEVHWGRHGEVYVTPVAPDVVGVALLTPRRGEFSAQLTAFPRVLDRLGDAAPLGRIRGAGPLRQRVRARAAGRVLLVGDAAGYVDALTGEGIALATASARELVRCVTEGRPEEYERAWRSVSRRSRWLTESLLRTTATRPARRALVPAARTLPGVFRAAVNELAR